MSSTPIARGLAVVALAASGLAGAATAQAATTKVEQLAAPTPVSAYAGTAAWSRLDAATGKYQLVTSVNGASATPVPIPERDGAFDVDLGTNRNGSTYAVYSRAGDLYRLSLASGVEQELTSLSSPTLTERSPTIERGRIAFIRRESGDDQLRVGGTTSGDTGSHLLRKEPSIQSIELGTQHISYVDVKGNQQRVHVRNVTTGHDEIVYSAGSGGASFTHVTRPSFADDRSGFVWARSIIGASGSRLVKYALHGGRLSNATGSSRFASVGWVSDELGAVASTSIDAGLGSAGSCTDAGVQYCEIDTTGPVSFSPAP